jgi:hypothetical protein
MPTGPATPTPSGGGATPATTGPTLPGSGDPVGGPVANFFRQLDDPEFSIIAKRMVGTQRKIDVLGVLTLYYGLQDRTLNIPVDSKKLFGDVDEELKKLRDMLDILGNDVEVLEREAKRQFNLGRNTDVAGNTEFPRLFKRYIDIANDPLLFLDIRKESGNDFSDKEKVARAFDLLRELKDVVVNLVRSLSKYGTIATTRLNNEWTDYLGRSMAVLVKVAADRLAEDDSDEKRPLAVLATLTGKNLDTQIAPYVALAREGGNLLDLALEAYRATKEQLENYDEQHLIDLFQAQNTQFLTTRMRASAAILRAFPLMNWP